MDTCDRFVFSPRTHRCFAMQFCIYVALTAALDTLCTGPRPEQQTEPNSGLLGQPTGRSQLKYIEFEEQATKLIPLPR